MRPTLLFLALLGHAAAFSTCPDSENAAGISSIDLVPDLPTPGEITSITIDMFPLTDITNGKLKIAIDVLGIIVHSATFDICEIAESECPLSAGRRTTANFDFTLPSQLKGGNRDVRVEVVIENATGKDVSCAALNVATMTRASLSETIVVSSKASLRASSDSNFDAESELDFLFDAWRSQFDIVFRDAEEHEARARVWRKNLARIVAHNASGASWWMGMNAFGHLTTDEWKEAYASGFTGASHERPKPTSPPLPILTEAEVADDVDWVKRGAVTEVKNQGICGSCWTFSATGAIEGAYQIAGNPLTNFSQEQILDCDEEGKGCSGGSMDAAFKWLETNDSGGVCTAKEYPYDEASTNEGSPLKDQCNSDCTPVATVTGFTDVDSSQAALMTAVGQQPVSVAIEADQMAFHFYAGGVMDGQCGTKLDHGVLVVGYGKAKNGKKFWKIKNSWGKTWGEKGYVRILRGSDQDGGQCGVLMMASFPTVSKK